MCLHVPAAGEHRLRTGVNTMARVEIDWRWMLSMAGMMFIVCMFWLGFALAISQMLTWIGVK